MKRRISPWLRRGKTVILSIPALLIVVWFLTTVWVSVQKGLYDPVTEFLMAERSCWVGPSDIQYAGDNFSAIGTYMDQVVISTGRYWLVYWPRNLEGPTLVPAEQSRIVAVDVPEGTARAELRLELCFYYIPSVPGYSTTYAVRERAEQEWEKPAELWRMPYVFQGERVPEGGVLFRLELDEPDSQDRMPLFEITDRATYSQDPWDNWAWAQMEAVFYDEAGNELGRAVLSTPEGGEGNVS